MKIIEHSVEKLVDPTGILAGDRYEFILTIEVPEDDELYVKSGLYVKAIFAVAEGDERIASYQLYEKETDRPLDFMLEDEEEQQMLDYCKVNIANS